MTADGGFLIADTGNNRVRRVSPTGTITTVAGGQHPGIRGRRRAGHRSPARHPGGVAVTADGGFLIADTNNQRVRQVSPAGTISTVAGDGTVGFAGDGGPAVAAQLDEPGRDRGDPRRWLLVR